MIYTEITPNPASLKFVVDRLLVSQGSVDLPDVESAADSPLALKLYDFVFVERVFFGSNFVTITKSEDFQWEAVIPAVKSVLKDYLASEEPIFTGELAAQIAASSEAVNEDDDELTTKIKQLLDQYVRPAVAGDGGDIVYQGFQEGTVLLKLQGSCQGCPSSVVTLKNGIEGLLKRMVPEVERVEAVG